MQHPSLTSADALIVVDVQNDFCPGGALPVESCDRVIAVLNDWIETATQGGALVVASRDWHPPQHCSFKPYGGRWPPHCIRKTAGAQFHEQLKLPLEAVVVNKGVEEHRDAYSAFDGTELADRLSQQGTQRVWIGGLALDVCVRATVLDALRAGFETHLIREATCPVDSDAGLRAVAEMREAGAIIEPEDCYDE